MGACLLPPKTTEKPKNALRLPTPAFSPDRDRLQGIYFSRDVLLPLGGKILGEISGSKLFKFVLLNPTPHAGFSKI